MHIEYQKVIGFYRASYKGLNGYGTTFSLAIADCIRQLNLKNK